MPEPNEKMDELLKACAKKRRDEAGAPWEIHPATRKLLQDDVARTYPPSPEQKKSEPGLFSMFWPRLIFGGAIFAALVAMMVFILSPRSSKFELSQNSERPAK